MFSSIFLFTCQPIFMFYKYISTHKIYVNVYVKLQVCLTWCGVVASVDTSCSRLRLKCPFNKPSVRAKCSCRDSKYICAYIHTYVYTLHTWGHEKIWCIFIFCCWWTCGALPRHIFDRKGTTQFHSTHITQASILA